LGRNAARIGVVYVGGTDFAGRAADTRTDAQRRALTALLRRLCEKYPGAIIRGHRDFAAKACPCFDATEEYAPLCAGR
ncbi:MAG: N-acetylmuramoyl-L-alanine amidase, partial [Muribaculaceae bacterium]|nr:N-acetylmuramoyl-L-alanine amidase [Muribaculaceae bacterium]